MTLKLCPNGIASRSYMSRYCRSFTAAHQVTDTALWER